MDKVFVMMPYMGRTDAELQSIRDETLQLYVNRTKREAVLSVPQGKRLTGDIEAMLCADVVVKTKYADYDPACIVVNTAANLYGKQVYEDRDLPDWISQEEIEEYESQLLQEGEGGESE